MASGEVWHWTATSSHPGYDWLAIPPEAAGGDSAVGCIAAAAHPGVCVGGSHWDEGLQKCFALGPEAPKASPVFHSPRSKHMHNPDLMHLI